MTISPDKLSDPVVAAVVEAINAGDRGAFLALLADGATMSDDGTDRDVRQWIDNEIFTVGGRMEVESQSGDGRSLIAKFTNDTWGEMRTAWRFSIDDGRVSRFETGQA